MPLPSPRSLHADIRHVSRGSHKIRSMFQKRRPAPLEFQYSQTEQLPQLPAAASRLSSPGDWSMRSSSDMRLWPYGGGLSDVHATPRHPRAPKTGARVTLRANVERLRCSAPEGGQQNSEELVCSVCLDDVCVGDDAAVLPCAHRFHYCCVEIWLLAKGCCPNCREHI